MREKNGNKPRNSSDTIKPTSALFQAVIYCISDAVITTDSHGRIVIMNPVAVKLTGWEEHEARGKPLEEVFRIVNEDTRETATDSVKRILKEGLVLGLANNTLLISKNGREIPIADSGAPIRTPSGRIKGAVIVFRDQTKERAAQKAMEEAKLLAESIVATIHNPLLVLDADLCIISANRSFYQKFKIGRDETVGKFFYNLDGGQWDIPELKILLEDLLPQNTAVDACQVEKEFPRIGKRIMRLNARRIYSEDKKTKMILLAIEDISEQKRSERMQKAQYNIVQSILASSTLNEIIEKIRRELTDIIEPKNFVIVLYDEKKDLLYSYIEKDEKDEIPPYWPVKGSLTGYVVRQKKTLLLKKQEIKRWIRSKKIIKRGTIPETWLGIPLLSGEKTGGVLVLQNYEHPSVIDKNLVQLMEFIARQTGIFLSRMQARAERELLSTAIEQAAETIVITDNLGTIQYVNPAFERVSGYSREEALGQNPRILKSGKHDPLFYENLWGTITSGKTWRGRFINKHKDGTLYTEEAAISPVSDANGRISNFVAVKRDITREEKLELQFRQAQKMESIGRLAGGVAHDFNNMLSVILGYSELLLSKLNPEEKIYRDIQEIHAAGKRSASLTTQLLAFARKQTIAPECLNLNECVSNMLKMLRRLIGENIELIWIPDEHLDNVYADPSQIDQILANLCVNARDAIGNAGKITLETTNVTMDDVYCSDHAYFKPGPYVMLAVSDDGRGMNEETRLKIFDPFFTTKEPGKGTGLGMSTVYGIVKQNNGFINVYSEIGKGTTIKIYLPRYSKADVTGKQEEQEEIIHGQGERILLVEDETAILELIQTMLEDIGYQVIAAESPEEAVLLAGGQKESLHLLMTDVVMPEMSGKELAVQLQKIHPKIKILYMSGYTSNIIAHRGILEKGVYFINKPFSMRELSKKIRQVLTS